MNAYNPNYFNRSNVNSMKNALRKIIVSEQLTGSEEGQPGMSISGISDLELQKRMRNKKNTSIFSKNPKQSEEYLELEREFTRRNTPKTPAAAPPAAAPPAAPPAAAPPAAPKAPAFDINKPIVFGMPQKSPEMSPVSQNMFAAPKREAEAQVASGEGAYSPTDTGSAQRGTEADIAAGYDSVPFIGGFGRPSYGGKPIENQEMIPPSVDPIMNPQIFRPYPANTKAAAAYERNASDTGSAQRGTEADIAAGDDSVFIIGGRGRPSYGGKRIQNQGMIPPSVDPIMNPQIFRPYPADDKAFAAYEKKAKATKIARNQMRTPNKPY